MNKAELEERLVNFAVLVVDIVNEMPNTKAGNHLSGQLICSGTSPALNHEEAQGEESIKDFIHKMKIKLEKH
ncbi:MAG: four helix bundle protein [Bacteroidota bacterium]|nr:four helix bundle protein [Bacteroidota bacterium]